MTHEKLTSEFVEKMRAAAGDNLVSVVLYGSAADGDFHPEYSDLNLLCLLRDVSLPALTKIASVVSWWRGKRHRPPLVITSQELNASADVFSIEFSDMRQRYRVLHGEDPLRVLNVPMTHHREQLEYELREKVFLLRQHLLLAGTDDKQLWEVMLHSLSSFTTLFRHVLVEIGDGERKHSREAVVALSKKLGFDDSPFLQLMDVRSRQSDRGKLRASDVAARYLAAITTVADAVDAMPGNSAAPSI
ncbi:MAG TPA: nucleotidyltransferase domain-containing protein [Terriglobales bacterium]|jgi:predicted nucleotidyltransferase|nr:nucleotidyltransferase domain-containing protein [Terriglobales bacterium]